MIKIAVDNNIFEWMVEDSKFYDQIIIEMKGAKLDEFTYEFPIDDNFQMQVHDSYKYIIIKTKNRVQYINMDDISVITFNKKGK